MEKITCRICSAEVLPKIMAIHLRAHHQMKFLDYVKTNIKDFEHLSWRECAICGVPTRKVGDKHKPTCSRKCLAEYRKTLVGDAAPRYGGTNTEETKKKMSTKRKEWHATNSHPLLGKHHSSKTKNKMSKAKIGLYDGEKNPMYGRKHTPESLKKMFVCRPMNSLESKVAGELDRLGLKYTYQFFIHDGELCRSYDFKLKRRPIIIEADGDYWHGNPNTKHHCPSVNDIQENDKLKEQMAEARGYKVIRFWESDVKRNLSVIETKLRSEGILKG